MSRSPFVRVVAGALRPFPALRQALARIYRSFRPAGAGSGAVPSPLAPGANSSLETLISELGNHRLVGNDDIASCRRAYERFGEAAMTILDSRAFADLPVPRQVDTMVALYNTAMSGPVRESIALAKAIGRHYARLLCSPKLTEPMACRLYDCLYGLYFAGAQCLEDLADFDSMAVLPFDAWIRKRLPAVRPRRIAEQGALHIAYLLHCAHFDKGNAVSPIIASLARAHAKQAGRRIFVYAVQWMAEDFAPAFGEGITVRAFPQDARYDRLDEIAAQMWADRIDVAIADLNSAVAASLFARRVAPLQMWIVMAYPYWSLSALDWTLLPLLSYQPGFGIREDRYSGIRVRQESQTLQQDCGPDALARARASLPSGAFIYAIFSRLVKISPQLLEAVRKILAQEPRVHLLIVGAGDPRAIHDFVSQPSLVGRVTFLHGNVDLNVYGRVVDAMFDTFPFHGGNVVRELNVHGKPVLAVRTRGWEPVLRDERDPELLAQDPEELVTLALRLARDSEFYRARAVAAKELANRVTDISAMVFDVEEGIALARAMPALTERKQSRRAHP